MHIDELRAEFQVLTARYGCAPPPELGRMLGAEERRHTRIAQLRYRVRHLETEIATAHAELGRLDEELRGLDKGMSLALERAIDEVRAQRREGWSPTPVAGFRLWNVAPSGIQGFRVTWSEPTLTATCGQDAGEDEVPHTDGRCGPPACGIYASKRVDELIEANAGLSGGWLIGKVEMTGKVVEHERGYRAQHAAVVAVIGFDSGRLYTAGNAGEIASLFHSPTSRHELPHASSINPQLEAQRYFETIEARSQSWI